MVSRSPTEDYLIRKAYLFQQTFYCPNRGALLIIVVSLPFTSYLCGSFIVLCDLPKTPCNPVMMHRNPLGL